VTNQQLLRAAQCLGHVGKHIEIGSSYCLSVLRRPAMDRGCGIEATPSWAAYFPLPLQPASSA
jgi:hypothetical protein